MSNAELIQEVREVSDFQRVTFAGFGELRISQGEEESLTVEAPAEILSRIKTDVVDGRLVIRVSRHWLDWVGDLLNVGFSGIRVRFELKLKTLEHLAITGAARVIADDLKADTLGIELHGTGEVKVDSLEANSLSVTLPGAGLVRVSGEVGAQTVTLSGAASYEAGKLKSDKAQVAIEGVGSATVWAEGQLDATIRGVGSISYYGAPNVNKQVMGPGAIRGLGTP
jgi:hypothetical protein